MYVYNVCIYGISYIYIFVYAFLRYFLMHIFYDVSSPRSPPRRVPVSPSPRPSRLGVPGARGVSAQPVSGGAGGIGAPGSRSPTFHPGAGVKLSHTCHTCGHPLPHRHLLAPAPRATQSPPTRTPASRDGRGDSPLVPATRATSADTTRRVCSAF